VPPGVHRIDVSTSHERHHSFVHVCCERRDRRAGRDASRYR
jgi:hypothetical protein